MSLGSMIGGSALGGGLEHLFQSADSFHMLEAENPAFAIADPLGYGFGKVLGHSEKKKAQKQLAFQRQQMQMQYEYQKLAALEMPSLVRQGFEDAGYNALLALGNTGGVSSAPNASGGDYPHESQRREQSMMLGMAMQNAEVQREKVETDIWATRIEAISNAIKSVGSLALSGAGTYFGLKGLGAVGSKVLNGKGLVDIPLKSKSAAMLSSAAGAAASLFTRALTPALAGGLYAGGQYTLGKHLESKGFKPQKLFNVKQRMQREMHPSQSNAPVKRRKHN